MVTENQISGCLRGLGIKWKRMQEKKVMKIVYLMIGMVITQVHINQNSITCIINICAIILYINFTSIQIKFENMP